MAHCVFLRLKHDSTVILIHIFTVGVLASAKLIVGNGAAIFERTWLDLERISADMQYKQNIVFKKTGPQRIAIGGQANDHWLNEAASTRPRAQGSPRSRDF